MSLDRSGAAQAPNHATTHRAADARPRPGNIDPGAQAGGGLSFLSLLAALEPAPDTASEAVGRLAGEPPGGAPTPELLGVFDPGALLPRNPNPVLPDASLTSPALPANILDPGAVLTQGQHGVAKALDIDAAAALESALPPVLGQLPVLPTLPAPPVSVDLQSEGLRSAAPVSAAGLGEDPAATSSMPRMRGGPAAAQRDGLPGAGLTAPAMAGKQELPVASDTARPDPLPSTTPAVNAAGARNNALRTNGEWLSAQQHVATAAAADSATNPRLSAPQTGLAVALDAVAGLERPVQRQLRASSGSLPMTGPWADYAALNGGPGSRPVFSPDPVVAMPEAAVAEKLNYWITRGVQNAELQLDAFGGGSVDVSISLNGNEAMVEFRSDQPEARKLLQDAMPQLRDMLEGEGLLLSGGFVGTSAQQDAGSPGRRAGPQPAKTSLRIADTTENGQSTAVARTTGRAVDVFV